MSAPAATRIERPTVLGTTADVLQFVLWIADRYQERTSRSFLGIHFAGIRRCTAIDRAFATYEVALSDGELTGSPSAWTQAEAIALADEDMRHWEVA